MHTGSVLLSFMCDVMKRKQPLAMTADTMTTANVKIYTNIFISFRVISMALDVAVSSSSSGGVTMNTSQPFTSSLRLEKKIKLIRGWTCLNAAEQSYDRKSCKCTFGG